MNAPVDAATTRGSAAVIPSVATHENALSMNELFCGYGQAHGHQALSGEVSDKGKHEGKATTVRKPVTIELFKQHIKGTYPLGIIPLQADNTVQFAAIDVDAYDSFDHVALVERIHEQDFPLIVLRSKSGGAHCYLFLQQPTPAAEVRAVLRVMCDTLGLTEFVRGKKKYPEIFPKQDERNDGDIGNWINLPYMGGDESGRYAFHPETGERMTLEQFLQLVPDSPYRLQAADWDQLTSRLRASAGGWASRGRKHEKHAPAGDPDDPWAGAPPCLRTLFTGAVGEFRNQCLMQAGVYLRMRYPHKWKEYLRELNQLQCSPPLKQGEVRSIIGSLSEEDETKYFYLCDQEPFQSNCDKTGCQRERYGVGGARATGAEDDTHDDFIHIRNSNKFIYRKMMESWPALAVDAHLPKIHGMKASNFIMKNNWAHSTSWVPGAPDIIEGWKILQGRQWQRERGHRVFNTFVPPPVPEGGDAALAETWLKIIKWNYPHEWEPIVDAFAHVLQQAHVRDEEFNPDRVFKKVNFGIVLAGPPGSGKDFIVRGFEHALGLHNVQSIAPKAVQGDFNEYAQTLLLKINELRDVGDTGRYDWYESAKTLTTAPPYFLAVNAKHERLMYVPNTMFIVAFTNHKTDGLYLPPDDRRWYPVWSEAEFELGDSTHAEMFNHAYRWLEDDGGWRHVYAFLMQRDVSKFKFQHAPVEKTVMWRAIVDSNDVSQNVDVLNAVNMLRGFIDLETEAFTIQDLRRAVGMDDPDMEFNPKLPELEWLFSPRQKRHIPTRLEECGYVKVLNPDTISAKKEAGTFSIGGKRQVIYVNAAVEGRKAQVRAALDRCEKGTELSRKKAANFDLEKLRARTREARKRIMDAAEAEEHKQSHFAAAMDGAVEQVGDDMAADWAQQEYDERHPPLNEGDGR